MFCGFYVAIYFKLKITIGKLQDNLSCFEDMPKCPFKFKAQAYGNLNAETGGQAGPYKPTNTTNNTENICFAHFFKHFPT